jgi:UDP-N-acetylglucosamine 2-epimerase (non-hydrolysing)
MKIRIACIIGTRPEVIKMAPIIEQTKQHSNIELCVINTAQHRSLLDDMLKIFNITPDVDMNIMRENQTLGALTGNLFLKIDDFLSKNKFDYIIAQGDTTTTLVAAQVAFYRDIPFCHVEAGLRSFNLRQPFPEEMNRIFVSKIATWHFAPTETEKRYLLDENVDEKSIVVTGNTVIDSLYKIAESKHHLPIELDKNKRIILVTLHRRESFGEPIKEIFSAFLELVARFDDIEIIYPVHPNPNVNALANTMLSAQPRIKLIKPVQYEEFVSLMQHAYFIMSDSGGIQEEAPALDKPVLILREVTERPLIVEYGMGVLVGSDKNKIVNMAEKLLTDPSVYQSMQKHYSPYGDGKAAERIVRFLLDNYKKGGM